MFGHRVVNMNRKRIIVGVTGASGSIYARLLLERLLASEDIAELAVIVSANGEAVSRYEGENIAALSDDPRVVCFEDRDLFAPPASGSAEYDAMVIVPCSMGTIGRIASGVSDSLMTRAADVMLKERRELILVPRESPFSTIHLKNMLVLSESGAVILPASPSFYSFPANMEQLCMTVVERILSILKIDAPRYHWGR